MPDLRVLVGELRAGLEQHPDLVIPSLPEGCPPSLVPETAPQPLADLLQITDGPVFSTSVRSFPARRLEAQQVSDALADASGIPDAGDFFCFGEACSNPLFVDVRDQSVWRVPDEGVLWYQKCRIEKLAASIEEFFSEWISTPRFKDLAGIEPGQEEFDDWYCLLQSTGRAPV